MKPNEIENIIRDKLGEMFGKKFGKRKLVIGYDSARRPQIHEFDFVSESADIVGEIKSGKCSRRNYELALVDCMYLSKVEAKTKLMVFSDKNLYEYFKDRSEGIIGNDIRVILVLPHAYLKVGIS